MTDQIQYIKRRDALKYAFFQNISGETIPAYGVMQVSSYSSSSNLYSVVKPDSDGKMFLVNDCVQVPDNSNGSSEWTYLPKIVLAKQGDGIGPGDIVGPVDGSWEVSKDGTGFMSVSPEASGLTAVVRSGQAPPLRAVGCELLADLGPASPDGTYGNKGQAKVMQAKDDPYAGWLEPKDPEEQIDVYNHSTTAEYLKGDFGFAFFISGYWRFFGDCPDDGSGSA